MDIREKCFEHAKAKYDQEVCDQGMLAGSETSTLKLANKTQKSGGPVICNDIYDLYLYICGLTHTFPKKILDSSCRYLEISDISKPVSRDRSQIYNPALDRMRLTELGSMIKDLQKNMKKLIEDKAKDGKKILQLEEEVKSLKEQVKMKNNTTENGSSTQKTHSNTTQEANTVQGGAAAAEHIPSTTAPPSAPQLPPPPNDPFRLTQKTKRRIKTRQVV